MTASGDLTAALGDKDTAVRIAAARALWHIRREAEPLLPVLTTALRDAKAGWQAIFLLGEIGPEAAAAIPSLIVALKQEKVPRPLRMPPSSAIALGKVGIAAVPELLECLRDAQPRVRASAAIALGFVGPKAKAAVPALAKLLADHAPEVRQAAALNLGEIDLHTEELPAVLAALIRDDDIFVSASAASLLQRIDPEMPIVSRE
jgi:HEAT repeat protein